MQHDNVQWFASRAPTRNDAAPCATKPLAAKSQLVIARLEKRTRITGREVMFVSVSDKCVCYFTRYNDKIMTCVKYTQESSFEEFLQNMAKVTAAACKNAQ